MTSEKAMKMSVTTFQQILKNLQDGTSLSNTLYYDVSACITALKQSIQKENNDRSKY